MRTNTLLLVILFITLLSCNSKQAEETVPKESTIALNEPMENQIAEIVMTPPPSYDKNGENRLETNAENISRTEIIIRKATITDKKIIKDGNIAVKVKNIKTTKKGVDNLLKKLNAYYENEELQNNDQTISYSLKIRVPAVNFEQLISSIENGEDKIESKNIQTRDVTEEYVDTETRLTNKRNYLKRYKELLAKATTVKDILAIEENVRGLQEEIESTVGRLNYLEDKVAFSTLSINLHQQKEYLQQPGSSFLTRTKVALNQGWQSIVDFIFWMLSIWPYFIAIPFVFFIARKAIRNRRNRQH